MMITIKEKVCVIKSCFKKCYKIQNHKMQKWTNIMSTLTFASHVKKYKKRVFSMKVKMYL